MFNKRIREFRKLYYREIGGKVEGQVFTYEEVKKLVEMYRMLTKDNKKDFKNRSIEEIKSMVQNITN